MLHKDIYRKIWIPGIVLALVFLVSARAPANTITFELDALLNGMSPSGSPVAVVEDVEGGGVQLTLDVGNLPENEFVSRWYFNLGGMDTSGLTVTPGESSGVDPAAVVVNLGSGAFPIGGVGIFDLRFDFPTRNNGGDGESPRLNGTDDSISFMIGGPITTSDFLAGAESIRWASVTAAQVQGIYDGAGGTTSGRVGAPVPEPSTLILLGTGLAGLGLFGRRRSRRNS